MRYLIDTHVVLMVLKGERISQLAKEALDDVTSEVFVSVASAWEIAIKVSIGKLKYSGGVKAFFEDVKQNGFTLLDIRESHIDLVEKLDYHHCDPFDRLLIATAEVEGMTFISADENVSKYNAKWLW